MGLGGGGVGQSSQGQLFCSPNILPNLLSGPTGSGLVPRREAWLGRQDEEKVRWAPEVAFLVWEWPGGSWSHHIRARALSCGSGPEGKLTGDPGGCRDVWATPGHPCGGGGHLRPAG